MSDSFQPASAMVSQQLLNCVTHSCRGNKCIDNFCAYNCSTQLDLWRSVPCRHDYKARDRHRMLYRHLFTPVYPLPMLWPMACIRFESHRSLGGQGRQVPRICDVCGSVLGLTYHKQGFWYFSSVTEPNVRFQVSKMLNKTNDCIKALALCTDQIQKLFLENGCT